MVSIVIPVFNEKKNLKSLLERLVLAMAKTGRAYEIILIDDHSTDGSWELLKKQKSRYALKLYRKQGRPGKAFSLIEGFKKAQGDLLIMIDADLQYPPEIIPSMLQQADQHGVVIARRKTYQSSWLRRFASRANAFIFGRLLLGLPYDVQSGLKIIKKDIIAHLNLSHISAWSIDLPLLYTARELGYSIGQVDIDFIPRQSGASKISFLTTALQIALSALKVKLFPKAVYHLGPEKPGSMLGAGIAHRRRRFITHTTLPHHQSALVTLHFWQFLFIAFILFLLAVGLTVNWLQSAIIIVAILSTIYFLDVLFNLYLILKSLHLPPEIHLSKSQLAQLDHQSLPVYSILCPLYHEAHVLPQFVKAISNLDWPKHKLDVQLLLEQDDTETIKAAKKLKLPPYIRLTVVPNSQPKTKPKACNYGLAHAQGDYVVIYDAEDIPDKLQLKKAYLAFKKAPSNIICLQAKLNYYNPHHNLLTKLFTAEYSLWFDVILTGLQTINTTIPLGGTSNHFRTKDLLKLQAWDPFNVTEDCDLGARLFKSGYQTAIIDSVTLEEANSNLKNWLRQRSRWIKGYLQTYLVHMRRPISFTRKHKLHSLIFQLVVGGKIAFMLINPFLWLATISYFVLYALVGPTIESLYPQAVFYMAIISLVFGNFMYIYYYMIGSAKRGHWSVIKYVFFVPLYWLLVSIGAVIALIQLILKPHYWEKTHHGLHLQHNLHQQQLNLVRAQKKAARMEKIIKLRNLAKSGIATGGLLIGASLIANFFNFLYNAFLGRVLSLAEFGTISLISSFIYLTGIPLGALGATVTHQAARLYGKYKQPVKKFWSHTRRFSLVVSLIVTGLWLISLPLLKQLFYTGTTLPFLLFTPVWFLSTAITVDTGFLTGNLNFNILALIIIAGAVTKLGFTWLLISLGLHQWVYAAIPASLTLTFTIAYLAVKFLLPPSKTKPLPPATSPAIIRFPKKFFAASALTKLSTIAFLSLDVILAKHYLPPIQAGHYALLSLTGKMIFFIGSLFGQFINPLISRQHSAGINTQSTFAKLFLATSLSSLAGFVIVGPLGHLSVFFLFGQRSQPILDLLAPYAFAMTAFTIASSIITYHQAKRQYLFAAASFLLASAQVVAIIIFHSSVEAIVQIMFFLGGACLLLMSLLHLVYQPLLDVINNLRDFLGLLTRIPQGKPLPQGKLRILILNWRDTKHVWSGGAEIYVHELAKRWVKSGHKVTLFCGNDGHNPRNQVIDGVQIVRRGGFYTVYAWALLYYLLRFRGLFDVVIDCENGIPFFTPLYVKVPKFLVIHHVHQEIFRENLKAPLSWLAMFLEKHLMPWAYRHCDIITVSQSSKKAIMRHRLTAKTPLVVHSGVDLSKYLPGKKSPTPLIAYVGRLKAYKNLPVLIRAMQQLARSQLKVKLVIAGFGEERAKLEKLVKQLKLEPYIKFAGKISEAAKIKLYQQAWVAVNPSSMEGWGITSIEANACGTPVVASNVPGLRDSVHNPTSGFLVDYQDPHAFADHIFRLLTNRSLRDDLSRQSRLWAEQFTWEKSANQVLATIKPKP